MTRLVHSEPDCLDDPASQESIVSDRPLQAAIMQALADNPLVHPDEIAVEANEYGDVVLRGTVGTAVQRAEVARTTRRVPGVHDVDDQLRVRLMGIDGRTDADTQAAVLAALIDDDELHAGDIDVHAHDGTVTLRGLVELEAQRDRAERIALGIGGVEQVVNRLRVWLAVSSDDVAERVTDAIGATAIVGADEITVSVVDNDVTLTGLVTSPEHREAALAAAANAPGVAHVHDALLVRSRPEVAMSEYPRPVQLPGEPSPPREPYGTSTDRESADVVDDVFDVFGAEDAAAGLTRRLEQVQAGAVARTGDGRELLSPPWEPALDRVDGPSSARATLVVFGAHGTPSSRTLAKVLARVRAHHPRHGGRVLAPLPRPRSRIRAPRSWRSPPRPPRCAAGSGRSRASCCRHATTTQRTSTPPCCASASIRHVPSRRCAPAPEPSASSRT
jgi:osmotically-inducible protein OsmY